MCFYIPFEWRISLQSKPRERERELRGSSQAVLFWISLPLAHYLSTLLITARTQLLSLGRCVRKHVRVYIYALYKAGGWHMQRARCRCRHMLFCKTQTANPAGGGGSRGLIFGSKYGRSRSEREKVPPPLSAMAFAKRRRLFSARAYTHTQWNNYNSQIPLRRCDAVRGVDAQSIVNFHMHDISNRESGKTHYLRSSKPFYLKTRRVFKKPSLKFTKKIRKCRQALIWCAAAFITPKKRRAALSQLALALQRWKKTPWLCVPSKAHQSIN